ncbi:hypothetical protein ACIBLA_14075 [Streptomyces sp. NPDC050433]|uniref:hypothetical protein n=1 Tax=Streptomyces sp. NPDC050433 TaxID=3365615 RepID=UPI0037BAF6D4
MSAPPPAVTTGPVVRVGIVTTIAVAVPGPVGAGAVAVGSVGVTTGRVVRVVMTGVTTVAAGPRVVGVPAPAVAAVVPVGVTSVPVGRVVTTVVTTGVMSAPRSVVTTGRAVRVGIVTTTVVAVPGPVGAGAVAVGSVGVTTGRVVRVVMTGVTTVAAGPVAGAVTADVTTGSAVGIAGATAVTDVTIVVAMHVVTTATVIGTGSPSSGCRSRRTSPVRRSTRLCGRS